MTDDVLDVDVDQGAEDDAATVESTDEEDGAEDAPDPEDE